MAKYLHYYPTTTLHDNEYRGSAYVEPWVGLNTLSNYVTYNHIVITASVPDKNHTYINGETITYTILVTNPYNTSKTIQLSTFEGIYLAETTFTNVGAGTTVTTTATHGVSVSDALAGTYYATFTAQIGNDLTKSCNVDVATRKRLVILTSISDLKVYDGTALTNDEVTVSGDGFISGEGAMYDVTGSQTFVGSSANEFVYTLNGNTHAEDYNITTVFGTLTIGDGTEEWAEDSIDPVLVTTIIDEGPENPSIGYVLGETVTFAITATNIYTESANITLTCPEGVTLAQSNFNNVYGGEMVETTATYEITMNDVLTGSFTTSITANVYTMDSGIIETDYCTIQIEEISEIVINTNLATTDIVDQGNAFYLTILKDNCTHVMNALLNGVTIIFEFTDDKLLVIEQNDIDNADISNGVITLNSSGNSKIETCFSDVITSVNNTELYFDSGSGTIDIVIYGE